MTQREKIVDLLEDGPLSTVKMAKTLHIRRTVVTATLTKLQRAGEVVSLARTWPRLYALTGTDGIFHEPDDLFNEKPSITKCSYCKKTINKRTRIVELRDSGRKHEIQKWGWCKPCFKEQQESRKIPVDAIIPHISTLMLDARVPDRRYPGFFHPRHKQPWC